MAQARPIFYPTASCRIIDPAVWAQIVAAYSFGTNIVLNVAPTDVATRWNAPLVNDPTATDYQNLPGTFTLTTASQVLGVAVSTSVAGGTVTGVTYTDADGVAWTEVDWQWQIDFEDYTVAGASGGTYEQEWITYTGDGTTARTIGCSANLLITASQSLVVIFPQAAGATRAMTWVTSDMVAQGLSAAFSAQPSTTSGGIVAFANGSFSVTDALANLVSVNEVGVVYDALIVSDTSFKVCASGHYAGTGLARTVLTALTAPLDVVFVLGRGGTAQFAESQLMTAGESLGMAEEDKPFTGGVTALGIGSFGVGTDNNVNDVALNYYWFAFALPAAIRAKYFTTFTALGTGSVVQATGIGNPGFVSGFTFAREYVTGSTPACRRRSPSAVGTASYAVNPSTNAVDATGGIRATGTGTVDLGTTVLPNTKRVYGFAFMAGGQQTIYNDPTWTKETTFDNGNGNPTTVEDYFIGNTPPDETWTLSQVIGTDPQWWCNAALGQSVFQIDSPGAGWMTCGGPASLNGWYLSVTDFGGNSIVTSAGRPANPRSWVDIVGWAASGRAVLGGSPGASCVLNNRLFFPASDYVVGTDYPRIHLFDGRKDVVTCQLPPTTANVVPKAVLSMLAANGTIYLTSWDSGTSSADWTGRVFELDAATGVLTVLGTVFAAGEMPYALAWHMGRLWCGTTNGIGTIGNVYCFRPGQDTAWTSDHSCTQGVDAMASFNGKLYVGVDAAAGSRGKVLVRDTAGAYSTSQTGSGGTAVINNGYLALRVFQDNLYASYYNGDAPLISRIEKFDGSSWTTVYTGVGGTLKPFILLGEDSDLLFALSGKTGIAATLLSSATGTSWTDLTAELPETTTTLLPMFGAVVL